MFEQEVVQSVYNSMSEFPLKPKFVIQIALLFLLIIMIQDWVEYLWKDSTLTHFWQSTVFFGTGIFFWALFSPLLYKQFHIIRTGIPSLHIMIPILILNSFVIAAVHQIATNVVFHLVVAKGPAFWDFRNFAMEVLGHLAHGLVARMLEYWLVVILLLFFSYSKLNEKYALDFTNFIRKILFPANGHVEKLEKIEIKERNGSHSINVSDVIWFESNGNYVNIHCKDQKHLYRQTMSSLSEQLEEEEFLRVHRSYIVNIDCIQEINYKRNGEYRILLTNDTMLVSGRSYQNNIIRLLKRTSRLVLSTTL